MITIKLVLLIVAFLCFILAACGIIGKIDLTNLGLAFLILSFIL